MALAGLRQRHPSAGESEIVARFALLTLGPSLACRVYPQLIDVQDTAGDCDLLDAMLGSHRGPRRAYSSVNGLQD